MLLITGAGKQKQKGRPTSVCRRKSSMTWFSCRTFCSSNASLCCILYMFMCLCVECKQNRCFASDSAEEVSPGNQGFLKLSVVQRPCWFIRLLLYERNNERTETFGTQRCSIKLTQINKRVKRDRAQKQHLMQKCKFWSISAPYA